MTAQNFIHCVTENDLKSLYGCVIVEDDDFIGVLFMYF